MARKTFEDALIRVHVEGRCGFVSARFRVELLDEDAATAARTIRAYQDLLAGGADAAGVLGRVEALDKLGVTEGTLAEKW